MWCLEICNPISIDPACYTAPRIEPIRRSARPNDTYVFGQDCVYRPTKLIRRQWRRSHDRYYLTLGANSCIGTTRTNYTICCNIESFDGRGQLALNSSSAQLGLEPVEARAIVADDQSQICWLTADLRLPFRRSTRLTLSGPSSMHHRASA
jgi:hypothetical protein